VKERICFVVAMVKKWSVVVPLAR